MSKKSNNNYTKEFKLKAIKMYLDEGLSSYQVASNLNIKSKTQVINLGETISIEWRN
ncbi:transposase [Clostridium sartagoforme]|uniref:transposase n=1 Tax=Clostridium sartagoforme TaxID=84031 RepID=UPI0031E0F4E1